MHKSFIYGHRSLIFLFCGLLGLLFGILFAAGTDASSLSLMRQAAVSQVSIVLLFLSNALPFLIAAFAVSIDQWNILFLLSFLRFFAWAFCAGICVRAFGTAAWLIQPMLQFSDSVMLLMYALCCTRWCSSLVQNTKKDLLLVSVGILLVASADYFIVSPFLAALF